MGGNKERSTVKSGMEILLRDIVGLRPLSDVKGFGSSISSLRLRERIKTDEYRSSLLINYYLT